MNNFGNSLLEWGIKAALFGVIFLFFPKKKSEYKTNKSLKELSRRFRWFNVASTFIVFVAAVLIGLGTSFIFQKISLLKMEQYHTAILVITPSYWGWLIGGLVLGFGLAGALAMRFTKKHLGDEYGDYMAYQTMIQGFDSERLARFIIPALIAGSLVIVLLLSGSYTVVYKDKIIVNYYLSFSEKEYTYQDITKVQEFTGKKGDNYFHITFNDGEVWNSRQNGNDDYNTDSQILDIIEEVRDDVVWE